MSSERKAHKHLKLPSAKMTLLTVWKFELYWTKVYTNIFLVNLNWFRVESSDIHLYTAYKRQPETFNKSIQGCYAEVAWATQQLETPFNWRPPGRLVRDPDIFIGDRQIFIEDPIFSL